MRNIVLAVVIFSSLGLSMGWVLKPIVTPTQDKEIRLKKEFKLLCKRYTAKSNQYNKNKIEDVIAMKALMYYDMKVEKYCNVKS